MFKKTAVTFLVKVSTSLINLIIVIVISRWMGAQGKGDASLIIAGITMLLLFCNMIGSSSLVYLAPRYNVFQLLFISNIWSLIVCASSYFILLSCNIIPEQFVFHVCMLALISSLIATNLAILLSKQKIMHFNIITFLQAVINMTVLAMLVKSFGKNDTGSYIVSLYIAMLVCLLLSTLMIISYIKEITFTGSGKIVRELIRLGFTNQAGHIMKFFSFRISYFLLNSHYGSADVGVYSNGISLSESILLITNSIAAIQYPAIANTEDLTFSQALTIRLTRVSILLCIMAMIPLCLLPDSFFTWLFGNGFMGARTVILLLAPGILFYNIALITGHYFSGTGKYFVNSLGNLAGLIVTIGLSVIYISSYTINTAAIISTVAYIATTITILYYFIRETKTNLFKLLPVPSDLKWALDKVYSLTKKS